MQTMNRTQAMNRAYRRSDDFVFRAIEGETILVPIRRDVADLVAIYRLNATGAFAWEQMDGKAALSAIAERLAARFDVAATQAAADLAGFVAELAGVGALVPGKAQAGSGGGPRTPARAPYEPPRVVRVPLDARCAVLGFCKQAGTGAGPALPGCRDPLFSPCLSQGS